MRLNSKGTTNKKRGKQQSSAALVKAFESVYKHQKKVKAAVEEYRNARDAVAKTRLTLKGACPGSSERDALQRSLEQAKQVAKRAAEKAAMVKAKLRTAKAKARALEFAEVEKLRKREEKYKRKRDLDKAIEAFVKKWNKKRDREEAAKEAKQARKYAIKLRSLALMLGDKEKETAAGVAEEAKAAARRATKARKKRV